MEVESKEKRENRKKIFSKSDFLCFNYYTIASRANRRVTSRLSGAHSKKKWRIVKYSCSRLRHSAECKSCRVIAEKFLMLQSRDDVTSPINPARRKKRKRKLNERKKLQNRSPLWLTSQKMVNLSSGKRPLASSRRKSRRMNFLKPQSLPCTKR